jgi:hypothetical protein
MDGGSGESMADAGLETMRKRVEGRSVCLNVIAGLRLQKLVENPNHVEEMELSSPTYAKLQAEIVVH